MGSLNEDRAEPARWGPTGGRDDGDGARGRTSGHARGGFTIVELTLAMTILLVALLSISASTLRSHSLRRHNRELVLAQNAIRATAELIHSTAWQAAGESDSWAQTVIGEFSPGGAFGPDIAVHGLGPANEGVEVGWITFVTDETATDADLGVELGMPRDLDGDGKVDNTDVSGSAVLLPVILTLEWRGIGGFTRATHPFYVLGY